MLVDNHLFEHQFGTLFDYHKQNLIDYNLF